MKLELTSIFQFWTGRLGALALSAAFVSAASPTVFASQDASAAGAAPDKSKLRICAAGSELPFSNREKAGFREQNRGVGRRSHGSHPRVRLS